MIRMSVLLIAVSSVLFMGCDDGRVRNYPLNLELEADSISLAGTKKPTINRFGKQIYSKKLRQIYTPFSLDTLEFPIIDYILDRALERNQTLLRVRKQRYNQRIGDLRVNLSELGQTAHILQNWQDLIPIGLNEELRAYQIRGKDGRGNVKFTGYFTPVIEASRTKKYPYLYPIRSKPDNFEGILPSRAEIENGALDTFDINLAYAKSKVDIYFMQQQGSGYVEYQNGKRELLEYNGQNRHPFIGIEQELATRSKEYRISDVSMEGVKWYFSVRPELIDSVLNLNPSYTFFKRSKALPKGAGHVPLTAEHSIAVDPRYIPLGSTLLASFPVLNEKGDVVKHEYRILLAQDVGGAIKGSGHVDYYFGVGEAARKKAMNFNHYGRLWLLLPKGNAIKKSEVGPLISANL